MIAFLSGTVIEESLDRFILDVNGVGYEVLAPIGTTAKLATLPDGRKSVRIYTSVREDAIQLFGFAGQTEKDVFLKLISISGVGPKLGLAILSELSVEELVSAVRNEDLATMTRISGVGKKTAQRLILELKSAVDAFGVGPQVTQAAVSVSSSPMAEDLRSALQNLGYKPQAVNDVITQLEPFPEGLSSIEPLILKALRLL